MNETSSNPDTTPEDLNALFTTACNHHENNEFEKAVTVYNHIISLIPPSALLHFNCGLALYELGRHNEADEQYRIALKTDAMDPDIPYNHGLNLRRLGQISEAITSFQQVLALGDTSVDTLYNLALCHQDLEQLKEAEQLYTTILATVPGHTASLNNYAYLCHKSGSISKAIELYSRLLEINPDHYAARHMFNSLSGKTPDSAPLEYVETVFDNYADNFEKSLVEKLHYKTPSLLKELYLRHFSNDPEKNCLDLGCGTGLAGLEFRSYCSSLTGLDISEKMLQKAADKNIYDNLVKDDILHYLQVSSDVFDMILAADVFTYLGDLSPIFFECTARSSTGALLLFSVEESTADQFELKATGRFGHSLDYIRKLSKDHGWTLKEVSSSQLRQDKGNWINGHLLLLEKN